MEFKFSSEYVGTHGIKAYPGDYDGTPHLEGLWFERKPQSLNPDRLAAAAILAFGRYCSGPVKFPNKISPAMAGALVDYLSPIRAYPEPIEYYPKAIPEGSNRVRVRWTASESLDELERRPTLQLVPSSEFSGAVGTRNSLIVASNARLMSALSTGREDVLTLLAAGVVFAQDLSADTLVLDAEDSTRIVRARPLLAAAGLGLELENLS
ncbi:hypothetical protein [Cellulosimicrobium sp. SJTW-1]|uniref:hypothetical protein n=1 Tax=Cellulosimicrobium sp. SJTW-1 TaxID=3078082 RepID=UPI0039E8815D